MEGKLHTYHPKRNLTLFEYRVLSHSSNSPAPNYQTLQPAKNVLLFIGGLYDNFLSPSYVSELASLFPTNTEAPPLWTVIHVQLSSANTGWGISNLDRDVDQIGTAVNYVRNYVIREHNHKPNTDDSDSTMSKENVNIVLMGHSTGCQDVLHYLHSAISSGKPRPPIQGAILQAPVSDREGALHSMSQSSAVREAYEDLLRRTKETPKDDWDDVILPMTQTKVLFGPTPISVMRFMSLTSPESPAHPSMDDMFSSDLSDDRLKSTFGKAGGSDAFQVATGKAEASVKQHDKPSMLILISGADEYMPGHVNKKSLLRKWRNALQHDGKALLDADSGVVTGGKHDLSGEDAAAIEAREEMKESVLAYLGRICGQSAIPNEEMNLSNLEKALSKIGEGKGSRAKGRL